MRRKDVDTSDKIFVEFSFPWEANDFQKYEKLLIEDTPG